MMLDSLETLWIFCLHMSYSAEYWWISLKGGVAWSRGESQVKSTKAVMFCWWQLEFEISSQGWECWPHCPRFSACRSNMGTLVYTRKEWNIMPVEGSHAELHSLKKIWDLCLSHLNDSIYSVQLLLWYLHVFVFFLAISIVVDADATVLQSCHLGILSNQLASIHLVW